MKKIVTLLLCGAMFVGLGVMLTACSDDSKTELTEVDADITSLFAAVDHRVSDIYGMRDKNIRTLASRQLCRLGA